MPTSTAARPPAGVESAAVSVGPAVVGGGDRLRDRGAATIEQLGVVVVVGLLFSAALLGFANYSPYLSNALCQLSSGLGLSAGSCDAAPQPVAEEDGPSDEDFLPPVCLLRETSNQVNSKLKIAFVTIGEDAGFVVSENSDETVKVTVTNGGALGVEGGFGGTAGTGDYGLGAKVDFGGGVTFSAGDSWTFESWDAWEAMERDLNAYLGQQIALRNDTYGGYHFALWLMDGYLDPPQDPSITTSTIGWEASVNANAGLRVNHGTKPDGKTNWFNPNLGVYGSGALGGDVTRTVNHATGEVSETFRFTADGGAGLDLVFGNAGGSGSYEGSYKVTRDAEGLVTSIEFMRETSSQWSKELDLSTGVLTPGETTNSGSVQIGSDQEHQHTVVTTALDVTDANRGVVDEWLGGNADLATLGGEFFYPANAFDPSRPVEGDPFAQLLYEESRNSVQVYDNVTDGFSFGAEFALGLKFGASFSSEENVATINSAYFLGAPTADGTRGTLEDATCAL